MNDNSKKEKSTDLAMDLWHSNTMKVILCKFLLRIIVWTIWTLNYIDCILCVALILFIWLTIKPNNLGQFYYRISEQHQTSISAEGAL